MNFKGKYLVLVKKKFSQVLMIDFFKNNDTNDDYIISEIENSFMRFSRKKKNERLLEQLNLHNQLEEVVYSLAKYIRK